MSTHPNTHTHTHHTPHLTTTPHHTTPQAMVRCRQNARKYSTVRRSSIVVQRHYRGYRVALAYAAVRDAAFEAVVAARTYKWQWCALHTLLPGGRRAAEGEQVQGKYQGADGGKNWFAGVVTAVGGPPPARAEI